MTGNQHSSLKQRLLFMLGVARLCLSAGEVEGARGALARYREVYAAAPASTRRRWKCGR